MLQLQLQLRLTVDSKYLCLLNLRFYKKSLSGLKQKLLSRDSIEFCDSRNECEWMPIEGRYILKNKKKTNDSRSLAGKCQ